MVIDRGAKKMPQFSSSSQKRIGHTRSKARGTIRFDEDGNVNFKSKSKPFLEYYSEFSDCRGKVKEEALSFIVDALCTNANSKFVQDKFVTLLYQFIDCIKRGSVKEKSLASKAIGVLAIMGSSDNAHEMFEESLPILSQALQSNTNDLKMIESLGIITFFCSVNADETQRGMQILWTFASTFSQTANKLVLAKAITTWTFLLSAIEAWRLNHKDWRGAISFLLNLLEEDDISLQIAAVEALAVITDTGSLEKFSKETIAIKQELEGTVMKKLSKSSTSGEDEDSAETTKSVSKRKLNLLRYFQNGFSRETLKIGKDEALLSTLSQKIQVNFMKQFLGEKGFAKHIKENKQFRDVFEVASKATNHSMNAKLTPEREEIIVKLFERQVWGGEDDSSMLPFTSAKQKNVTKRLTKSPNSDLEKATTQLRNKNRAIRQQELLLAACG